MFLQNPATQKNNKYRSDKLGTIEQGVKQVVENCLGE